MHRAVTAVVPLVLTTFVILPELVSPTKVCKTDEMTVRDSQGSFVECFPCQPCLEGLELFPECGSNITKEQKEKNIECRPCKPGFFSDKLDVHPCQECRHCLDAVPVKTECTNMTDTECGNECRKGFYHEKTSLDCQQCSCCCGDSKDIKIAKCVKDNKPANHHCTSHRHLECCKKSPDHPGDTESKGGDTQSKLAVGIIIGIVLVTAVVVGIILSVLWFYCLKRKRPERTDVTLEERPTDAANGQLDHQTNRKSEELEVELPSYEQANGSVHHQGQGPGMNGNIKRKVLSNPGFAGSAPGTPEIQDRRDEAHVSFTQPPQAQDIKRQMSTDSQKSTSSDSDKTDVKQRRSSSISSVKDAIIEKTRKVSYRQRSHDEAMLIHEEEDVRLPDDQTFTLSDLCLDKIQKVGMMLDTAGYGVGSYIQIATIYKMDKLSIQALARESNPGDKVLQFINSRWPKETVYKFCKVLHSKSMERNDIVEELCKYLHDRQKIDTQPTSDENKSYI